MFWHNIALAVTTISASLLIAPVAKADRVLYDLPPDGPRTLNGTKFDGPIFRFQTALSKSLKACGKNRAAARARPDGIYGAGTRNGIRALQDCEGFRNVISNGAITESLYEKLLPGEALPSSFDRAMTLTLHLEGTDFDEPEFNFCQSSPKGEISSPENSVRVKGRRKAGLFADLTTSEIVACFSNDRRSYLTWGPFGATAGHGAEVQRILFFIDQADKTLLNDAFGEATAKVLRSIISLRKRAVQARLCPIYLNEASTSALRAGFANLAKSDIARSIFIRVFLHPEMPAGRIGEYTAMYDRLGIEPSELDIAFFLDRAVHMGPRREDLVNLADQIRIDAGNGPLPSHAEIRRSIAQQIRPSNQRRDRLGRDVVYYVDSYIPDQLSRDEQEAWQERTSGLKASSAGLSDDWQPQIEDFQPIDISPTYTGNRTTPTAEELAACPGPIMSPRNPTR
ncbi:hypothetical protein [uncultured Roseibium sp.]|uniref:hypothetical protein n=1 Tax=uncultured Roseibium sp. TaxID=1936171 RepID=UPI0032165C11